MFERYTDRARRVIVLAQEQAKGLNHNYIGTEHILLGLLIAEGLATKALGERGVTTESVKELIEPGNAAAVTGHIPMTARAKKVFERSLREALNLGQNYIGVEHLLLALTHVDFARKEKQNHAILLLYKLGVSPESIRDVTLQLMTQYGSSAYDPASQSDPPAVPGPPVELRGDEILMLSTNELVEISTEEDGSGKKTAVKIVMASDEGRRQELTIRFGTEYAHVPFDPSEPAVMTD